MRQTKRCTNSNMQFVYCAYFQVDVKVIPWIEGISSSILYKQRANFHVSHFLSFCFVLSNRSLTIPEFLQRSLRLAFVQIVARWSSWRHPQLAAWVEWRANRALCNVNWELVHKIVVGNKVDRQAHRGSRARRLKNMTQPIGCIGWRSGCNLDWQKCSWHRKEDR